ncbi:MAG TPA: LysR family transcriptional regulator [Steroidobacteraceae bacterium]|nr:LysR family transcriptional regulator [Steroidobacteraceae bacterium]
MDIRQLETFLWIARLGSIADACKRLNATQSTLSMRLRALEDDLRVPLFNRDHKRLTLTAKGRDLMRYAEKIVHIAQQARVVVSDPQAQTGTIRIGVAELIALTWLPQLIKQLNDRYPNVTIDLDVGTPRPLTEALNSGTIDLALVPALNQPIAPLAGLSLGEVEFSWMASPKLGFTDNVITPQELEEQPLIGVAAGQSVMFAYIQQWFIESGSTMQRYNPCNSLAATIALVAGGFGIGFLPNDYCAPLIERGELRPLRTTREFKFEFFAVCILESEQTLIYQVAELARQSSMFKAS